MHSYKGVSVSQWGNHHFIRTSISHAKHSSFGKTARHLCALVEKINKYSHKRKQLETFEYMYRKMRQKLYIRASKMEICTEGRLPHDLFTNINFPRADIPYDGKYVRAVEISGFKCIFKLN